MRQRLHWLTRLLGVGVLALVGVTWKLWTPQDVFPRVPLFRWAPPDWWDWLSLGLILAGGFGLMIRPARHVRTIAATLACGLAIAFICDQHRLQPWAWQFFILALLIALADDALLWNGWQWLTISIYFYSALSKFDSDFLYGMGNSFFDSINQSFRDSRLPFMLMPQYQSLYPKLAWVFPLGELLCAVLLTHPRGKTYGWIGSAMMHLVLIRILGPSGLKHSWGVLLWNFYFIPQIILLFGWTDCARVFHRFIRRPVPNSIPSATVMPGSHPAVMNGCAQILLALVLIAPSFTPWQGCDLWPGWAVYVKPYEEAFVRVDEAAFAHLAPVEGRLMGIPGSMISPPLHSTGSFYIPFQSWSLNTLKAPAYPHVRCSLAVALDLAERFDGSRVEVRLLRRTRWEVRTRLMSTLMAHSEGQLLASPEEIHQYCKRFWFNAYPTSMYRRAAQENVMSDDG